HFCYMMKQTFGRVNKTPKGEGTITPRQALTSALSSTIGAANIVGVPTAIVMGGPGAVFWMMVIAFLGMALKFSENVLGVHYREKNKKGEFVGGPRSEEHTSELQSRFDLVCRLLLEKKQ